MIFKRKLLHPWCGIVTRDSKVSFDMYFDACRNAFYGSAEVSSHAVLPLVAQMPRDVLGPDPGVMSQLLGAAWQGWQVAGNLGKSRPALSQCFAECLAWALARSQQVTNPCSSHLCCMYCGHPASLHDCWLLSFRVCKIHTALSLTKTNLHRYPVHCSWLVIAIKPTVKSC